MIDNLKPAKKYYVATRPQTNDSNSIHMEGCPFMPDDNKRIYLGTFKSGEDARRESKKFFPSGSVCRFCMKEALKNDSLTETRKNLFPTREQLSAVTSGAMLCFLN